MPRWICPSCNASIKVAASHLGTHQPCAGCGVVSEVVDSSFPLTVNATAIPAALIRQIVHESPALIHVVKMIHVFGSLILSSVFAWLASYTSVSLWYLGIAVVALWLAFCWLFYEFYSDVFRCRRLLEEIAKK